MKARHQLSHRRLMHIHDYYDDITISSAEEPLGPSYIVTQVAYSQREIEISTCVVTVLAKFLCSPQ